MARVCEREVWFTASANLRMAQLSATDFGPWFLMVSTGFYWFLLVSNGFYWFLLVSNGF